jgi:hypothetical protein
MSEEKKTVIHLKEKFGDSVCAKCKAVLTDEGVYTYSGKVYNNPPPGHCNCRSLWIE